MENVLRPLRIILLGNYTAGMLPGSTRPESRQFIICQTQKGSDVLTLHPEYEIDIIFFELTQEPGNDLAVLERVCEAFSSIPVIAVVQQYSEATAESAFRIGVADVWNQDRMMRESFPDDVRQAIHLRKAEVESSQERSLEQALQLLSQHRAVTRESIRPEILGLRPIKESMPAKFLQLATSYGNLLPLNGSSGKVAGAMSLKLQFLASDLGNLRAGAGDIIDMYKESVRRKPEAHASPERDRAILMELMNNLASFYRRFDI